MFKTVDEYISSFPEKVQTKLIEIRKAIKEAAPSAEEMISYNMPAFFMKGNLVYFGAFSKHIGFYHASSAIEKFKTELTGYLKPKSTIKFSLEEPLPLGLIKKIVKFRVEENLKNENIL